MISGERPVQETEGRVYQQVEIEAGPFRRVVELNADVVAEEAKATYEDGILRVELPLRRRPRRRRRVPIEPGGAEPMAAGGRQRGRLGRAIEVVETAGRRGGDPRAVGTSRCPAALPVLPLREMVPYPDTLTPLAVGPGALDQARQRGPLAASGCWSLVASRDPEVEEPGPDQLYDVGVAGIVARMLKVPDGTIRILVQGTERVRIGDYVAEEPYLVARIEPLPDVVEPSPELEALTRNVQRTFTEIIEQIPYLPEELQLAVTNVDDPSALAHLIAGRAADLHRGEAGAARGGGRRRSGCAASPRSSPASWR